MCRRSSKVFFPTKRDNFVHISRQKKVMGSTLKEKNLLLGEQILFFKSRSLCRRDIKYKVNGRAASSER